MRNGSAAQPSLPHDELLEKIEFGEDAHSKKRVVSITLTPEAYEALILAQRQEAVREALIVELEWVDSVLTTDRYPYLNDKITAIKERLAELQTYLEGERH